VSLFWYLHVDWRSLLLAATRPSPPLMSFCCAAPNSLQVEVETQVDESILGGLQVMVGDRFLDLSVASRVADLTQALETAH
jgi:hypothetical protein